MSEFTFMAWSWCKGCGSNKMPTGLFKLTGGRTSCEPVGQHRRAYSLCCECAIRAQANAA